MVKANFQLANLCGTVYRQVEYYVISCELSLTHCEQGNLLFTNDGNSIISPLGNRVAVFDLVKCVLWTLWLICSGWILT